MGWPLALAASKTFLKATFSFIIPDTCTYVWRNSTIVLSMFNAHVNIVNNTIWLVKAFKMDTNTFTPL